MLRSCARAGPRIKAGQQIMLSLQLSGLVLQRQLLFTQGGAALVQC